MLGVVSETKETVATVRLHRAGRRKAAALGSEVPTRREAGERLVAIDETHRLDPRTPPGRGPSTCRHGGGGLCQGFG